MSKEYRQNTDYETILLEDKKGRWVTINSTPMFIKNGQSVEDAIEELRKRQEERGRNERQNDEKNLHQELWKHDKNTKT